MSLDKGTWDKGCVWTGVGLLCFWAQLSFSSDSNSEVMGFRGMISDRASRDDELKDGIGDSGRVEAVEVGSRWCKAFEDEFMQLL